MLLFCKSFLSPSGDLGIGLVWDNHPTGPPQLFGPTVEILFKLNLIIYEGSSVVLRMISDDFKCFPMFSAVFRCFPTVFRLFSDDVFRLLKSSSSWSKLSMMGPQLFSGWYQMILDVFQCSQLCSDVFRLFSDSWNPLQTELNYLWWVLSCYHRQVI